MYHPDNADAEDPRSPETEARARPERATDRGVGGGEPIKRVPSICDVPAWSALPGRCRREWTTRSWSNGSSRRRSFETKPARAQPDWNHVHQELKRRRRDGAGCCTGRVPAANTSTSTAVAPLAAISIGIG